MSLPVDTQMQLVQFIKPKIVFNPRYNQYSFNGDWLIDITANDFKEEVYDIILKVNKHLQVGLENKQFLNYMLEMITTKIDWFVNNEIENIKCIGQFAKTIRLQDLGDEHPPRNEEYTIEYILAVDEIEASLIFEGNYNYNIRRYANLFQNYSDPNSIENVKLHYVLDLYFQYLMKLYHYLEDLIIDFELINFSEYSFEHLLAKNGFIEEKKNMYLKRLCHVNLNKKDTAVLFMILMDEKIFEFDKNEMKNKVAMQKFIENNFSYRGEKDSRTPIQNIKQSFSDIIITKEVNQLEFIDELVTILQLRKGRIK